MVLIPRNPVNQDPLRAHDAESGTVEAGAIMYLTAEGKVARITTSGQAPYGILFQRVKASLPGLPANFEFPGEIGASDARLGDQVLVYLNGGTFESSEYVILGGVGVAAGTLMYCLADGSADAGKLINDDTSVADMAGAPLPVAMVTEALSNQQVLAGKKLAFKLLI